MFLPPYSPQLNIVKGLWGWLEQSVIYNDFFSKTSEIQCAVKTFMDEISKDPMNIVDRLLYSNVVFFNAEYIVGK